MSIMVISAGETNHQPMILKPGPFSRAAYAAAVALMLLSQLVGRTKLCLPVKVWSLSVLLVPMMTRTLFLSPSQWDQEYTQEEA